MKKLVVNGYFRVLFFLVGSHSHGQFNTWKNFHFRFGILDCRPIFLGTFGSRVMKCTYIMFIATFIRKSQTRYCERILSAKIVISCLAIKSS